MIRVSLISITPVKCMALSHPESIELTAEGVLENRRFILTDGDGKRLRSSLTSWPMPIRAEYHRADERLSLRFPDGTTVRESALGSGEPTEIDFHGRIVRCRPVPGEWDERLSALAGHPVRLMRPEEQDTCRTHRSR